MKKALSFFLILLLYSCQRHHRIIYLTSSDQAGLTEGNNVCVNGFRIGKIDKLSLTSDFQILTKITLDDSIPLHRDSKFMIKSTDIFGTSIIDVTPGVDGKLITDGDTLALSKEDTKAVTDSLSHKVEGFINKVLNTDREDSLVKEVKKLNGNVEKLQQQLKTKP